MRSVLQDKSPSNNIANNIAMSLKSAALIGLTLVLAPEPL